MLSRPVVDCISSENYYFYYDETNNFRKLYLSNEHPDANYLNSKMNPFILGGLVTKVNIKETDAFNNKLSLLMRRINFQKTQKELKFEHVASGEFESVLKSAKLKNIFEFISENEINIHFKVLDVVFWAIIDILDSKTAEYIFYNIFPKTVDNGYYNLAHMKSHLYEIARRYRKEFFKVLYDIGYPNIDKNNKNNLIAVLYQFNEKYRFEYFNGFIEKNPHCNDDFVLDMLNTFAMILEAYRKGDADCFKRLNLRKEHEIIDKMNSFYQTRIDSFLKSNHYFDEEHQVSSVIDSMYTNRNNKNYTFIKSEDCILIQLSDVIIGFVRVMYEYLLKSNYKEINKMVAELTSYQIGLLELFYNIYDKSNTIEHEFFRFIISVDTMEKFYYLKKIIKNVK